MSLKLSNDQIEYYEKNGYLKIPNVIPKKLLAALQKGADRIIEREKELLNNNIVDQHGIASNKINNEYLIFRVNDLFRKQEPVFFELLGYPMIKDIIYQLIGKSFISTYESLLIKNLGDVSEIGWHRDMVHDRTSKVITFGIYLDRSTSENGALKVIPGSQNSSEDVCYYEKGVKQDTIKPINIEVNPGDILIYDVMVVHSSGLMKDQKNRRTVYFEFRSVEQAKTNPGFSDEWIETRLELMKLAEFKWNNPGSQIYTNYENKFISEMYEQRARMEPGQYCFNIPTGT